MRPVASGDREKLRTAMVEEVKSWKWSWQSRAELKLSARPVVDFDATDFINKNSNIIATVITNHQKIGCCLVSEIIKVTPSGVSKKRSWVAESRPSYSSDRHISISGYCQFNRCHRVLLATAIPIGAHRYYCVTVRKCVTQRLRTPPTWQPTTS